MTLANIAVHTSDTVTIDLVWFCGQVLCIDTEGIVTKMTDVQSANIQVLVKNYKGQPVHIASFPLACNWALELDSTISTFLRLTGPQQTMII